MAAYNRIVDRARDPGFFTEWGIPDTLDGRFETLSLHAFIVLNRLKAESQDADEFAQDLFDTMFADLDRALREMGASDIGVGRYVKEMARGLYGRLAAYEQGLNNGDGALEEALRRNLYGTTNPEPGQLKSARQYLQHQVAALRDAPLAALLAGDIPFPEILLEIRRGIGD
jgi:cytochrome b pre-mRNA-processing protein 3